MKGRSSCNILLVLVAAYSVIWTYGKISENTKRIHSEETKLQRRIAPIKQSINASKFINHIQTVKQKPPTASPEATFQEKYNFVSPTRPVKQQPPTASAKATLQERYKEALSSRASDDGTIILAMVDEAFVDMALNLYLTSFLSHGIKNFLFLGAGARACDLLLEQDGSVPCLTYTEDKDAGHASKYQSAAFLRKMNIRTHLISDALAMGFTVVHTDADMFFVQNPLPFLTSTEGDIMMLWDSTVLNAGFLMVRPTEYGKEIYKRMDEITRRSPRTDDQQALNIAVRELSKKYSNKGFKAVTLDKGKFLSGLAYFENGKHMYPGKPCAGCMVVHNNWIVSMEAKVYRFKEHLMWKVDRDEYYSSSTRMYLAYDNINFQDGPLNDAQQLSALKAALAIGKILNRTVILPKFFCKTSPCPLNSILKLVKFDQNFAGKYREHSFRNNSLVPPLSDSVQYLIATPNMTELFTKHGISPDKGIKSISSNTSIVTDLDIQKWMKNVTERVLSFHSLHGLEISMQDVNIGQSFQKLIMEGFIRGKYRQF